MTTPANPLPPVPRVSVAMHLEDVANSILTKLFGLAMFCGAGYFDFLEVKSTEQTTSRLAILTGVCVFGAALAVTGPVVNTTKAILVVVGPYIPVVGRRKDDAA